MKLTLNEACEALSVHKFYFILMLKKEGIKPQKRRSLQSWCKLVEMCGVKNPYAIPHEIGNPHRSQIAL